MAHESMGISLFLLVLIRLTWRWRHRAPPWPSHLGRAQRLFASLNHWLLYAVLLGMPISGYLMAGNGQAVPWFRLAHLPGFSKNPALGIAADTVHVAGQFALYSLVILHVAAVVWHVAVRRDGLLERMLPEQTRAER
jgi:cytochrome b561